MNKKRLLVILTIVLGLTIFQSCSDAFNSDSNNSYTVYITEYGSCYHKRSCSSIKRSKNIYSISKADAIDRGYRQCSKCKP